MHRRKRSASALHLRPSARVLLASGLALVATACGEARHEIGAPRVVRGEVRFGVDASTRHGFNAPFANGRGGNEMARSAPRSDAADWRWTTPDGWTEKAPSRFRLASFDAPGGVDVSLSVLPGRAGGVADNVNRWRGQLGLAPLAPEQVEALPRRPVAGRAAVELDMTGSYSAQGGAVESARMLGIVAPGPAGSATLFVKVVGPDAAVLAQRGAFEQFVDGLEAATAAATGHGAFPAPPGAGEVGPVGNGPIVDAAPAVGAKGGARGLQWQLPVGWTPATSSSSMRLASFHPGGDPELDAYVVLLPGAAGGVKANLDRWQGQVGLPPISASQLDAMPRVRMLGSSTAVLRAIGTNSAILGVCATHGSTSVFVKLVGPPDKVDASWDDFLSFCQSFAPDGEGR